MRLLIIKHHNFFFSFILDQYIFIRFTPKDVMVEISVKCQFNFEMRENKNETCDCI